MIFRLVELIESRSYSLNPRGVKKYRGSNATVIGWYKRGEINDISNDDSQNEVESSEIGYHVVCIYPTNNLIITRNDFKSKKFDMSE